MSFPEKTAAGGASAADVWGYATRKLTNLSDVRAARIDAAPAFITPTESSVAMDGTEKTLYEVTDVKSSEVEAWVDLTPMAGGDTIVVRYYRKVKTGGAYVKYAEETYSDAQSTPLACVLAHKIYRDTKVTAQQTAGVNRTLDIQVLRAGEA